LRRGVLSPLPGESGRAGMIAALALLLLFGLAALVFVPRQSKIGASRREVMTRFMEQDYGCCDLATARSTPRCEDTLRQVASLAAGEAGPGFAVAAGNALARCPAADLSGFAGDPAVLRQPVPFLARKLQAAEPATVRRAARLLVSDSTIVHEVSQGVLHGRGPVCWGARPEPDVSSGAAKPECPGAPKLIEEAAALFSDEKEDQTDRRKAAALLNELGPSAAAAAPALARALESRSPEIRGLAFSTLTRMGPAAFTALPALNRRVHREPLPGLREQMLSDLGRMDHKAGCCYGLFHTPDPLCSETLGVIARRSRQQVADHAEAEAFEECPAALVLEMTGNDAAIAHPMPSLAQALRAPDIGTRRRAADAVALVAGTLHGHSRVDRDVVSALQDAFRSGITPLSLDAADALRQVGDASLSAEVPGDPEVFRQTLADESSDRRAAAAWALGQLGRKAAAAIPALRKVLDEPDEALADAAYGALNRIAEVSGLGRLGFKRDGKYELKPEVMTALLDLSRGPKKTP